MIASLSKGSLLDDVLQEGFNEQQLAAYVSWVNSQLRRRPGLKPVADLRRDLQDGVVLAHLIEIVAGEVLEGVHLTPRDREESRENVERVLQFISSKHIRMPHTSARDIVDGNLKSVMRLILALAAHFKPSANQRAASGSGQSHAGASANHRPLSTVAMAQSAAAALAAARLDASRPGRHTHLRSGWSVDEDGGVCVRALVQQYERGTPEEAESAQPSSLSSSSPPPSPRVPPSSQSESREQEDSQTQENSSEHSQVVVQPVWVDPLSETLEREMQETRKMISALQALLLHGSLPEDEQELSLGLGEDNAEHQLVVIRSRLDQSMEETQDLKREVLRCRQEMRNLQGVKEAQQQRLCVQEASVLQLKQELLRASMARDELTSQNTELQRKLEERSRLLSECKREVGQKDRLLQQHKHKLEESHQQKTTLQKELEYKDSVLHELMGRELHQQQSGAENNGYSQPGGPSPSVSGQAEELQLVRDALRSLRNNLRDHDPQHHTLDTLEQGIASLTERLHSLHTQRGRGKSPGRKAPPSNPDSWPTRSKMAHSQSTPALNSAASTKVLYFTGPSLTPFMISIPKRLGEVTLRDVKAAVDREGKYRYHFKALDPEFGTVKEEVFVDEAVVPGWEGKIVAWVEEDNGEERT
ncbi:dixin isoform X1 [Osmerus eperlanus]|uniref:dixin isoform X1 n=1 Tax=Osmerus eperlanus TaxID=29151 RepID=UPI002E16626F